MSILVVIESPDDTEFLVVHAAPADLDVPGDPGPVTACGIETIGMTVDPWRPDHPGARWYPPDLREHVCPRCDRALRTG